MLTRDDFTQVDGHWVYVIGRFQLNLSPDEQGNFRLTVTGVVGPIPAATKYPTEPEWEVALDAGNKFVSTYKTVLDRDKQN